MTNQIRHQNRRSLRVLGQHQNDLLNSKQGGKLLAVSVKDGGRRQALDLPDRVTGPALEGVGLVFKCLKRACDGGGVIFRCANITGDAVRGALVWPEVPRGAIRVDLAEMPDPQRSVRCDGNRVVFEAAPREVVTILVRP